MLLLALACAPGTIVLGDGPDAPDDTAIVADDTGDTGDTDIIDGEPDFAIWEGSRLIETEEGCSDEILEEGYELGPEWEYYDYVVDYCPECDHFYYVEMWPEEVCGIDVASEAVRGVTLGEDWAEVWTFYPGEPDALDDDAVFDGWVIDYDYRLWDGYLDIEGRVEFPPI